jgi:hypothetical protein
MMLGVLIVMWGVGINTWLALVLVLALVRWFTIEKRRSGPNPHLFEMMVGLDERSTRLQATCAS